MNIQTKIQFFVFEFFCGLVAQELWFLPEFNEKTEITFFYCAVENDFDLINGLYP